MFAKWLPSPLWLLPCLSVSNAVLIKRADIRSLLTDPARQWSSQLTFAFPGSVSFVDATERWTIFDPPTYNAVLSPATEEDVIKAVQLATANNISFLATGGRHGYTTTIGDLDDGLAIDLSLMKALVIDKAAQTLTVGPGVKVDDILDPVYAAGFLMQTGTASCPGLIGVTLGGGVGRFTGLYGLMIDALISVRIVTANGKVQEVSKKVNPELFWAIRGAGANFGIITSATYKLHPLPNNGNIFTIDLIFPANMTSDYFKAVQTFSSSKLPAKLAGISIMAFDSASNSSEMLANWIYVGNETEARKVLAPILTLNPPYSVGKMVTWNKLINSTFSDSFASVACQEGVIRDIYTTNLKNYSASTWESNFKKMSKFLQDHPGGRNSAMQFELYPNQAMSAVAADETAFPWRDAMGYFQAAMSWAEGDNVTASAADIFAKELRRDIVATSGYAHPTTFVNYAHGDEKLENIYGRNKLTRLAHLKKRWDPNHFFSWNNRLPTQY